MTNERLVIVRFVCQRLLVPNKVLIEENIFQGTRATVEYCLTQSTFFATLRQLLNHFLFVNRKRELELKNSNSILKIPSMHKFL